MSSTSRSNYTALLDHHREVFYTKNNTRVFVKRVTANTLSSAPVKSVHDVAELNRTFEPATTMRRLSHENINQFVGICLDYRPGNVQNELGDSNAVPVALFEYQVKHSLRHALRQSNDSDWALDTELKNCYIADCVRGMCALHEAGIVHGFLHTGNIVLDSKLTCKITNYGLAKFGRERTELEPVSLGSRLLRNKKHIEKLTFRSPEQLRAGFYCCDVKKSDIYSIGMVLNEVIT